MTRTLLRAGLTGFAAFVVAVGIALVFRSAVVEVGLRALMRAEGIEAVDFVVQDVSTEGLRIADVRLGVGDALSAETVHVAYSPRELLHGRLARVTVEGLTA